MQYVGTDSAVNEPRYILARIEQKIFQLVFRLELSLTPDLSIQYYGQPFVARGQYSNFKRITQPRASEYSDRFRLFTNEEIAFSAGDNAYSLSESGSAYPAYTFANPDFNILEFRSNLVLRWEFKPGSALFLVWSQGRTDNFGRDALSLNREFGRLFAIPAENIFLVKFSYGFDL